MTHRAEKWQSSPVKKSFHASFIILLTAGAFVFVGCRGLPAKKSVAATVDQNRVQRLNGGIIRGDQTRKAIAIAFTGHEFAEGGETILGELKKHDARASFFLTGEFLINVMFQPLATRIAAEGHYLGVHSDKHLLYCSWDKERKTLITQAQFQSDLKENIQRFKALDLAQRPGRYFIPPFEHYNQQIVDWADEMGLVVINFTPGTRSNADYTEEADKNFVSSQTIFDSIVKRERDDPHGLNGFILLLHIGSGPGRADKFHTRFGELLDYLSGKGYEFVRVDELLESKDNP